MLFFWISCNTDSECNYNGVPPIDYSVYISTGQPLDTSVCSTTSSCSGLMNRRDREIRYLKDAHTKALEKANRLEQLLAERDNQLKFQADALAANSELRQDLECQVLELQIQVTLFHEQCVQELRKAGITETRLKPPTIRRWNDVSERRRRLVDQACSVASRPSGMNRVSHKTTFQHRTGIHLSRGPTPSILNVDQGIDALSYQSSESGSRSMTSSVKSGRSTRPKSLLIIPGIFRDEVEVGQEIDVEDNLPLVRATSTSPHGVTDGFVSTASGLGGNYLSLNMRVTEPSSGYGASYHRAQSHPESPADSQSPIHFGIQQMPESGEKFVLITDRPSPSTLSSAYSLNELSTVGVHKSPRPCSDDAQFPRGKHPMNRSRPFLAPARFCPTQSADKSHSSNRGPSLHHSQTTSPRFSEKSPTIQHLQSTLLENQALIDSLTSDDRMDASSEFDSHDMMNSNKDFYQLTSQSDEEFVSDSEIAVKNLCSPHLVISAHKLRPDLSTKSKPSAPIQPALSSLSTNPDAITRDPSVPPNITTSCDT
ncbi:hypothetical protein FGIG_00111 [Fasciola gigantica]|uniref:Uncharacterized protein n=1 Tax=Fasciola gigantica TaxID=46835 RepID=A0A504YGR8_FASGI|nr:hypothetical protein FGIG_00111 [Fasciola gigantica]